MSTGVDASAGVGRLLGQAQLSQRQAEDLNLKLAEHADDSGGLLLIPASDPRGVLAGVVTRKITIGTPPPALLSAGAPGRGAALMSMGGAAPRPALAPPAAPRAAPPALKGPGAQSSRKRQDDDASTSRAASAGAPPKRPKTAGGGKGRASGLSAQEAKDCLALVDSLLLSPKSFWFREPVDPAQLPDYFTVISTPMDLGTVKCRLEGGEYDCVGDFESDVRQVWANCKAYNQPGTDAYRKGEDLEAMFERKAAAMRAKLEARAAGGGGGGGGGGARRASGGKGSALGGGMDMAQMQQMMMAAAAMNPMMMMMMAQQQGGAGAGAGADNPMLAQMAMMQQMMAAGGMGAGMGGLAGGMGGMGSMGGGMGGMGAGMGGMGAGMGMGGMGAQAGGAPGAPSAAKGGKSGGKAAAGPSGGGRLPAEPMSYAQKLSLTQQIAKLKPAQVAKVAEIVKRDPTFTHGGADEVELDLDKLEDGTLWRLSDYVGACKGHNAKKKGGPLPRGQQLDLAKARAEEAGKKISQLHRGAQFGGQPYMQPLIPRPAPSAGPGSASQGGSRKAPGFPMASLPLPSKSASMGAPPKPLGGGGGGGDSSSDSDSDDGAPAAKAPARPMLGGAGAGLPLPLGLAARPRLCGAGGAGASSGGTAGSLLGKGAPGLNKAWANLSKPAAPTAAAGGSKAWELAIAARKSANAQREQASLGQAAAQREREAAAARALEEAAQAKAQQAEQQRAAERKAREELEAARAAARAEREKLEGVCSSEPASNGEYNFDDFNQGPHGQPVE